MSKRVAPRGEIGISSFLILFRAVSITIARGLIVV
jgi:hypothetical protein